MSGATARWAPQSDVPLACHTDPDRWFDPAARTQALAACLACPHRRWCARRALSYRPSAGMWAGVWINGRFAAVAGYLEAIATDTPLPRAATSAVQAPAPLRHPARSSATGVPVGVASSEASRVAPKVLVWARSSGHCEVMSTGCGLSAVTVAPRISGPMEGNASALFAVCEHCAATVRSMDSQMARRLGFELDDVGSATVTPFFWRQTHRLLLAADGSLHAATDDHAHPKTAAN